MSYEPCGIAHGDRGKLVGTTRGAAMSGSEDAVTIRVVHVGWNDKWNVL